LRGTLGFIAPELHGFFPGNGGQDLNPKNPYAADMWSLGEIAFQLLVKKQTFANLGFLYAYVQNTQSFPSEMLIAQGCKTSCQDFIKLLMKPASRDRLTADQALSHEWIQEFASTSSSPTVPSRNPSNQHVQQSPNVQDLNTEGTTANIPIDLLSEEFATWNTIPTRIQASRVCIAGSNFDD
jgi:serine/threonine protein kinase